MLLNMARNSANADGHRAYPTPVVARKRFPREPFMLTGCSTTYSGRGLPSALRGVLHWVHRERSRIFQQVGARLLRD